MARYAYVNGRYVDHRAASVHIEDRGYQLADGVYEVVGVRDGKVAYTGKIGEGVSVEDAVAAAKLCFVNLLAQLQAACGGDLERVQRVVRLGGFIAAPPSFTGHAGIMNGASDMAVAVFGDRGRHARSTIGVPSLPMDAAVEVEGMFQIG